MFTYGVDELYVFLTLSLKGPVCKIHLPTSPSLRVYAGHQVPVTVPLSPYVHGPILILINNQFDPTFLNAAF